MVSDLSELARQALAVREFKGFADALAVQPLPESFGVLSNVDLTETMKEQMGGGDVSEWVMRPKTWNAELYAPDVAFTPAETLLHLLWQDLSTRLLRKLDAVVRRTSIAPRGAILCFFGRAALNIIVEYRKSPGAAAFLQPIVVKRNPDAVFELSSLLDESNPATRNAVKNAAFSVDKLVFERGSIVHVNRYLENVFGPTIDTVILAELIAELLDRRARDPRIVALEVGPGSGLLSAILASSEQVRELIAIDLNPDAATCTIKNLHINDITIDAKHQCVRVRAERFFASEFANRFNFIVCNPPYIPDSPESSAPYLREYSRAVGGVGLCLDLLKNLPMILMEDGVLLLMTSSVSYRDVIASLPEGFEATPALAGDGRRVPLDVDVVWRDAEWRRQLLSDGQIEQGADGRLWHLLRPLWIRRKA